MKKQTPGNRKIRKWAQIYGLDYVQVGARKMINGKLVDR